jgi:hypothetical protein
MGSSCVLVIVVGALWGKVIMGKVGEFLFCVSIFFAKRIGQSHDFCFFLYSGLCQSFPSLLCGEGRESEFGQKQKISHAFLEVCLRIIQELEEVRGFSCSEASYGRAVLVRVVFASSCLMCTFILVSDAPSPSPRIVRE